MEDVRIYTMTHKVFEVPGDTTYVPLHVGRAAWKAKPLKEKAEAELETYLGDDTGDNISDQNCYYSELTGLYWVWKNDHTSDIIGTCHYRRYLLNDKGYIFTAEEVRKALRTYDVITTKNLDLNFSYYDGFGENHKFYYLDQLEKVIQDIEPDYLNLYRTLVHQKHTYFGNMMICRKELYDQYMTWLFGILFELQSRITIEEEDSYHRRIFGFISEFLLFLWIKKNKLKTMECMVGMLGEKAETREIKTKLGEFLERGDFQGAKRFFLESKAKRPDILMEASDITGELHLCMEAIAIAGLEQEQLGSNFLEKKWTYKNLMTYLNQLNACMIAEKSGGLSKEQQAFLDGYKPSQVAKFVARSMYEGLDKTNRK